MQEKNGVIKYNFFKLRSSKSNLCIGAEMNPCRASLYKLAGW